MAPRKPDDFPSPLKGGEDDPQQDERIGEVRHDVERDEGGPTHDRSGATPPRRRTEVDDGEGEGDPQEQ
jgi:hypothetical protein